MPPGHNLSERDRDELYKKLVDEYFATDGAGPGILKSWLVGKDEDEGQVASAQLKPNETGEQYADHLEKWQEDDEATNDE
jgi:hypothetical protein